MGGGSALAVATTRRGPARLLSFLPRVACRRGRVGRLPWLRPPLPRMPLPLQLTCNICGVADDCELCESCRTEEIYDPSHCTCRFRRWMRYRSVAAGPQRTACEVEASLGQPSAVEDVYAAAEAVAVAVFHARAAADGGAAH